MLKLLCLVAITVSGLQAVEANGDSRLFGGQEAVNGQFPHHVQIRNISQTEHDRPHCGGSIIAPRFVLTAATCFWGPNNLTETFQIVVGDVDRTRGLVHQIDKIIFHPDQQFLHNNIAVVRVKKPFAFTANVRAVKLPTVDTPITVDGSEVPAMMAGWGQYKPGKYEDNKNYPRILQWTDTTAISRPECLRLLLVPDFATKRTVCTRNVPGISTCFMDGGSGLITQAQGAEPVIIGLQSLNFGLCPSAYPDVHTRVFPHLKFIRSVIRK